MNGRQFGAALIAGTLTPPAPASVSDAPVPTPADHEVAIEPAEQAGSASAAPSAFVSWAHSSEQWQETIGDFTVQLRRLGIPADVDLFEAHNPQVNWATYGPKAIERNDFVIIAVNAAYRERWEANNDPHVGSGAAREANVLKGSSTVTRIPSTGRSMICDHKPRPADVEWRAARATLLERHTKRQAHSTAGGHSGSTSRIRAWFAGHRRREGES